MQDFDGLTQAAAGTQHQFSRFVAQHRRAIVGTMVTVLVGFGAAAFGIAPLAPDAALLPQHDVVEAVPVVISDAQLDALATHSLNLTRSDISRASDTIDTLLRRLGVSDPEAQAFFRQDPLARRVAEGRPGKMVQVSTDRLGHLTELVARYPAEKAEQWETHFTRLTISRVNGHWSTKTEQAPLAADTRLGSGTIRSSLFAATDEARVPDPVASQLAEVFSSEIDFHRELRKGDTFSVVYEALTADGQPIAWNQGAGRVLAAEFVNGGKPHFAVLYRDANGKDSYFDLNGESKRRAFLASPMEFSRVTSGFAMRMHPIQNVWKAHLGVDYGAPTGTPVRAVGDGTVEFAGWQNGFGNVVHVKHSNDRTTVYAHLSRIDVRKGQRISQAQRVGAVGSTGWATGPHLHFEFRVKGQHHDPRLIARAAESIPLDAASKPAFHQLAASLKPQLSLAESLGGPAIRSE